MGASAPTAAPKKSVVRIVNAQAIVTSLLENDLPPNEGPTDTVDVEYHAAEKDGMPHVGWLLRMKDGYVATGMSHSRDKADQEVKAKEALLGVKIGKIADFCKK